eukprot:TRINITY_DN35494_c0_g1_i1.p1 TRINITY_DN35494_c0_g1~~TRINITY_DN35494_c0_g1_i1.p1  ORF type:complete len:315 (-),score=71.96 TRINITY_DN35494_c0_g1_i1:31-975(-)
MSLPRCQSMANAMVQMPPAAPHVKVQAFRQFANQLCIQVTEQLCEEFEREVNALTQDVLVYRNEMVRVAELLANQLGRERQLHEMLNSLAGHHANLATQAQQVSANKGPNKEAVHRIVEQMFGETENIINTHTQGWSQASAISQSHMDNAKQLQEPMISAENELGRIMSMLQQQGVSASVSQPAAVRSSAATPPRPGMTQQPAYPGAAASIGRLGMATPPLSPGGRPATSYAMLLGPGPGGSAAIPPQQMSLSPGPAALGPGMPNGMAMPGVVVTAGPCGAPGSALVPAQLQVSPPRMQGMPGLAPGTFGPALA